MDIGGAKATIDLNAIKSNYELAKRLAPSSKTLAVIKANAYGHGMLAVADGLIEDGVDGFCVATVAEGVELRSHIGSGKPIVILQGALDSAASEAAASSELQVVIQNQGQLDRVLASSWPASLPTWLKCDTGMHRLGMTPSDMRHSIPLVERKFGKDGFVICSHFACADEVGLEFNSEQLRVLRNIQKEFAVKNFSMANSGGIMTIPEAHGTYNRLGFMLYGNTPLQDRPADEFPLRPAMRVTAPVIALREVPAGETVGYSRTWTAPRPSIIATLAIGYGDGYPRTARSGTPVLLHGQRAQLVGRVSMDSITVDVTNLKGAVRVGDEACLWGSAGLNVNEVASYAGTIGYELLTRVLPRLKRVYVRL